MAFSHTKKSSMSSLNGLLKFPIWDREINIAKQNIDIIEFKELLKIENTGNIVSIDAVWMFRNKNISITRILKKA
jgi:hypothetical protein